MVALTEDMITARTRVSNMAMVKKLNCWGADLTDIRVVRNLHSVEVLSLSLNKLTTLSDFQPCKNLQELFVRKNQIQSLSELVWLRDLGRLKHLWLAENPCAEGDDRYRQTVIHNLPQLEKLDNIPITSEERADARFGRDLEEGQEEEEDEIEDRMDQDLSRQQSSEIYQEIPARHVAEYRREREVEGREFEPNIEHQLVGASHQYEEAAIQAPAYARCSSSRSMSSSRSLHLPREEDVPPYREMDRDSLYSGRGREESVCCDQYRVARQDRNMNWAQGMDRVDLEMIEGRDMLQSRNRMEITRMQSRARTDMTRAQGTNRRRNRNSNMLSAILCLLKEIDIPSLEVVEMAVRCRMEEEED